MLKKTADPNVFIEEQRPGYVRYRNSKGRRWEVHGFCDRRGDCMIGAVVQNEEGEDEQIKDHEHLRELSIRLKGRRLDSELDVPVTPEFNTCCGDPVTGKFRYVELEPLDE